HIDTHTDSAFFLPSTPNHRHLHSFPTRRSSDLAMRGNPADIEDAFERSRMLNRIVIQPIHGLADSHRQRARHVGRGPEITFDPQDRKSTRLNSSHLGISYAVFCLKKKKKTHNNN